MRKSPDSLYIDRDKLAKIRENIRDAYWLLEELDIKIAHENTKEIWCSSPFRKEANPSFHIRRSDLAWYDFGSGEGGGPLELIQKIKGCNIYKAGIWAVEKGLTLKATIEKPEKNILEVKEKKRGNAPLDKRFSLVPYLRPYHQILRERGISQETCKALGCGFLPMSSKSPLRGRIVFQIRGVQEDATGELEPVILSHIGRALNDNQAKRDGKWRTYGGFEKSQELYNIDRVLLADSARKQVEEHGLLIVEGCFDVAKLHEAAIENVVATLTGHLTEIQLEKLQMIIEKVPTPSITIWYDNDQAGQNGTKKALEMLFQSGMKIPIQTFDWESVGGGDEKDACDCSVLQIQRLHKRRKI